MTAKSTLPPKVQTGSAQTPAKVVKHVAAEQAPSSKSIAIEPKVQMGSAGMPAKVVKHVPQA